jgi:hypothetical protein
MLKTPESMKELEGRAAGALGELMEQAPAIHIENIKVEAGPVDQGIDILARINVYDREVKSNGQPRNVRAALLQLRNYIAHFGHEAVSVFIAPYLSPEAQALCKENEIGFLDLVGNAPCLRQCLYRTARGRQVARRSPRAQVAVQT